MNNARFLLAAICICIIIQTSLAEETKPQSNPQVIAAAASAAKTIKSLLPSGWSLQHKDNIVTVTRDKKIPYIPPNSPDKRETADYPMTQFRIQMRFGPLMSTEEYEKLLDDNHKIRQELSRSKPTASQGSAASRFRHPKAVIAENYFRIKQATKQPPKYYTKNASIWVIDQFQGPIPSYPVLEHIEDDFHTVPKKIFALFKKHQVSNETMIKSYQSSIKRIEAMCTPEKGATREEVEMRFGNGEPDKKLPNARRYNFCENGTLIIFYDKDTNSKVMLAEFINPYEKKGSSKLFTDQERIEQLKSRLDQMNKILQEYEENWSAPVNGLKGRLFTPRNKISIHDRLKINLELKNTNKGGGPWLAVQQGNPTLLEVQVTDTDRKPVKPTSGRADIFYSSSWKVLRPFPNEKLSIPATISDENWSLGANFDTTKKIWKLPPGKYRINVTYSSPDNKFDKYKGKQGVQWSGKLILPPIEIEIADTPPLPVRNKSIKTPNAESLIFNLSF